jgi:hypothetical protein
MSKNIFRQKRSSNFTVVPNEFLHSSELSFKAKGLLSYLLSLPSDWEVHISHLATASKDGQDSVSSGIAELIEAKYVYRRPRCGSEPGGWEYFIYDCPQEESPFGESPTREIPNAENPDSGKTATTKNYKNEQRTKETKDTRTTEEFVEYLKKTYDWVDIDIELKRIDAWLARPANRGRNKTRRFVENWISRQEKPMQKETYKPGNMLGIYQGSYRSCL